MLCNDNFWHCSRHRLIGKNNFSFFDFITKIILINNNGGGIFRILPGHQENETFNTFFETSHHLTAEHLAKMYQFKYVTVSNENELESVWNSFISDVNEPAILEIFTPEKENNGILLEFFRRLK